FVRKLNNPDRIAQRIISPSTDPTAPTPITAGTPISADYGGDGHYFVFTAPAAGVYTLALAAPPTAQANHCDTTDGCLCNPGGNCCIVGSAETTCTYDVRQFGSGGPLAAGEVVYPTVYMRPGTSAVYTLRIDAR
ncbi:MAG TPA: hypothetical protein PK324_15755, partial [Nocardioides sp.]|nr:hypothetical protein [Nocardioides sp.]